MVLQHDFCFVLPSRRLSSLPWSDGCVRSGCVTAVCLLDACVAWSVPVNVWLGRVALPASPLAAWSAQGVLVVRLPWLYRRPWL